MDRDTFEQLVNQWLDQPEREDLRERINLAIAADAELRKLFEEWVRFDRVLRGATQLPKAVDWNDFRRGIDIHIERSSSESSLERSIRRATDVEQRVDWGRLHGRITRTVHAVGAEPRVLRFPRRVAAALALLSAAAAVVMMMTIPQRIERPHGAAHVFVVPPTHQQPRVSPYHQNVGVAPSVARVTVSALPEEEALAAQPSEPKRKSIHSAATEVFLMVEPMQVAVSTPGNLAPYPWH